MFAWNLGRNTQRLSLSPLTAAGSHHSDLLIETIGHADQNEGRFEADCAAQLAHSFLVQSRLKVSLTIFKLIYSLIPDDFQVKQP